MLPGTFRAIMATAAIVAAVAGCSLVPAPTAAPAGQAEREVLIGQFIDAVEVGDAAAIAGMTDPVVDARADIAAILEAHGSRPWSNVRVAWGADELGGQAIWADITGTTPLGPDSIRILTIWDTQRATLALGAAPGIDPGSDPSSPRP